MSKKESVLMSSTSLTVKWVASLLVINLIIGVTSYAATADLVPVSAFSRLPAVENIDLSPNGSKIVYIQNVITPKKITLLRSFDFATGEAKYLFSADNEKTKINWVNWANEDVLIVSAITEVKEQSLVYYATRMYSIDLSKDKVELKRVLRQKANVRLGSDSFISQFQDSVIDYLPDDPEHILVEVDFDVQLQPSVFKVNVRTGKRKRIERGKLLIRSWYTDQQSVLRAGKAINYDSGLVTYYIRENEDAKFEKLFTFKRFEDQPIHIKGFGLDPNILYYTKYEGNTQALFKMNLATKESELILGYENYDVSGSLIYSNITREAIGIYDPHSPFGKYFFDDKDYLFHKAIKKAFPDTSNFIVDMSYDERQYVVHIESATAPGMYLLGNRDKNKVDYLFSEYPELDDVAFNEHEKIVYKARDGIEIEAYLSLPKKGEAPYPTIIHPHGGPGARDYDGFDPWVAYMNSRGYAVMRPNFRGSTGYGWEFAQAQMGRWGLEMQDDITDAALYLVEQNIADKDKMCIFGASYGGYAAAMATVKTPELFKCAVSFAGVSDLRSLARNTRKFVGGKLASKNQLGDDRKDMNARSPMRNVDKIKTPILLIHGDNDVSVPVKQSRQFADRLEDADKVFKYVELEKGDHYLSIQKNRDIFFEELDTFLQTYLSK